MFLGCFVLVSEEMLERNQYWFCTVKQQVSDCINLLYGRTNASPDKCPQCPHTLG